MTLTQEDYNSMMREIGDRPMKPKNNLPDCPKCGERYLGNGVDLCTECQYEAAALVGVHGVTYSGWEKRQPTD